MAAAREDPPNSSTESGDCSPTGTIVFGPKRSIPAWRDIDGVFAAMLGRVPFASVDGVLWESAS